MVNDRNTSTEADGMDEVCLDDACINQKHIAARDARRRELVAIGLDTIAEGHHKLAAALRLQTQLPNSHMAALADCLFVKNEKR